MKKIFAVVLILSLMFSFAACGLGGGGNGDVQGFEIKSEEEVMSNLSTCWIEMTITGGDGTDNTSTSIIIAENDKAVYVDYEGEASLYVKSQQAYYSIVDGQKTLIYQGEDAESYAEMGKSYLALYTMGFASLGDTDTFLPKGIENVAGRKCAKYAFELNLVVYKLSYAFWFDFDTGICMKQELAGSAEGESGFYAYEVTKLQLSNVNLDQFINLPTVNPEA